MQLIFKACEEHAGMPLRNFLRTHSVSSTAIKRAKLVPGALLINGAHATTDMLLKAGDEVCVTLVETGQTNVPAQDIPLKIAGETQHYMLVNKPAGQVVHPTRGYIDDTLAAAFMNEMVKRGQQAVFRPVGRLDKNTSGLVVLALNAFAQSAYSNAAHKVYFAVLQGELPLGSGEFNGEIDLAKGSSVKRAVTPGGKQSRTVYRVLATGGGHSLAAVVPVTGRTHQIRVHFSCAGFPLAGDDLYGGQRTLIARHALHCAAVKLPQPGTGKAGADFFYAPPSEDFLQLSQGLFAFTKQDFETAARSMAQNEIE